MSELLISGKINSKNFKMTISDNIKQLISDGKTQEALDVLQECLRDKDQTLLNQTYLLESQYKELQKKISLGLQDATTELNRINFTLLSLCDEVTKVTGNNVKSVHINKTIQSSDANGDAFNPLIIFGIIAALAIGIILLIIYFLK